MLDIDLGIGNEWTRAMEAEGYSVKFLLGQGSFGRVYLAQKGGGASVALKQITFREDQKDAVESETRLMQQLDHPNVIGLSGVYQAAGYWTLVLEWAKGGDLATRIENTGSRGKSLSEGTARSFFTDIVTGLAYCHDKGVCHRDVKPLNVLLVPPPYSGVAREVGKVCDFGLSVLQRHRRTDEYQPGLPRTGTAQSGDLVVSGYSRAASALMAGELAGTPDYLAPEAQRVK